MHEQHLAPRRGGVVVGWFGDDRHLPDRLQRELKPLTGSQARRPDDLDLHPQLIPATDAVDGLAAETDLASEFTDSEFLGWRDGDLPRGGGLGCGYRSTNPGLSAGAMANLSTYTRLAAIWGWQR
jgi:hypothetical protein